jgi:Sulfatase
MLDVLLISVLLFLAITVVRRAHKQPITAIGRMVFVVSFVLGTANLILVIFRNPPFRPLLVSLKERPQLLLEWHGMPTVYYWITMLGVLAGLLAVTAMAHSLIYRRQKLIKLSATIILVLSPFALLTFTQATAQWIRYRAGEQFQDSTAPALLASNPGHRRVVWLIFDELDFRLAFLERPSTVELPEFDKFRKESIFAGNSYPPAGDTTISLPALISGRLVSRVNRSGPNELELTFKNETASWSTAPNVFSRARANGLNSGLAGWFHPYCRVIGSNLTRCSWETTGPFLANEEVVDLISDHQEVTIARSMFRAAEAVLLPKMIRMFIPKDDPRDWRQFFVRSFNGIHERALAMSADANLHLVMIHYPIPHPPGIYDRFKNESSLNSSSGYLDNLALADRVLGQLRQKIIDAGLWENTTVLISSDHRLRADHIWRHSKIWQPTFTKEDPLVFNSTRDERVPFILKLPGESENLEYERAFNTVLSSELILAVLSGEITTREDAVKWLDLHRSIAESPYVQSAKNN